jgi:hypothetical protein
MNVSEKPILPHPRSAEYGRARKSKFLSVMIFMPAILPDRVGRIRSNP